MIIKSIDQLKLKLLDYSDTERLERHVEIEIAFAQEKDATQMLTQALKQSQLECAGLRSQLQRIVVEHG